jgi:LPXTG-motif cell wall-anchored protein
MAKSTLFLIGGGILVLGVAYFVFRKKETEPEKEEKKAVSHELSEKMYRPT